MQSARHHHLPNSLEIESGKGMFEIEDTDVYVIWPRFGSHKMTTQYTITQLWSIGDKCNY